LKSCDLGNVGVILEAILRSGDLDRRIFIQDFSSSQNASGEEIKTWSTTSTVWAKKIPKSVAEKFQTEQEFATADLVFQVRNIPSITVKSRIVYSSENYDILGTQEVKRSEGWLIFVKWRDNG